MMAKEKQHCNPSYLFPCPADSADKKAIIAPDTSLSGFTLQAYNYTIEPKGLAAFGSIGILHKKRSGKPAFQSAFMSGDLSAQGNFKILRNFDTIFRF